MHEPSVARNVDLENAAAPQSSDEEADKQEKVQCSSKTNVNKKKLMMMMTRKGIVLNAMEPTNEKKTG